MKYYVTTTIKFFKGSVYYSLNLKMNTGGSLSILYIFVYTQIYTYCNSIYSLSGKKDSVTTITNCIGSNKGTFISSFEIIHQKVRIREHLSILKILNVCQVSLVEQDIRQYTYSISGMNCLCDNTWGEFSFSNSADPCQ